ncbi:MAG: sigma-70 family RNA polymerase sigma factor, partial [Gemmatimonadota bacterium]
VCDSGRAVKDDDGRVLYYEGTLEDITELKLAEQELRESSELHLLLFQCSPLPMWVFETATNRFLAVNDAAVDHYGYSREEFLQMTILQIRPEEEVQALLSYSATARDGYDRAGIWRHRKKDGAYINVEIFCHEVNFAGMPAKLVLASDVTERLRAAAKLKESEERYRLLARASRDAIWDWNVVTGKVTWNEALRTVFGYPPESVGPGIEQAYLWWKNHIHPPDRERAAANFHAAVNGGAGEWYCEYRFRRLDGSCVLVSDRGYIGRNEKGEPARMIGSLLDLTSRTRSGSAAKPRQPIDLPPVPPTADATLVAWLTAGNERALEELCKRYGNVVSTLAESILKDPADAEELVTDVFQHVWRLGDRYDAARGTVLAWLLTITRRRAIDRLRTRERRKQILGGAAAAGMASSAPSAQTEPDGADDGAGLVVEQQLARLPDSQRLVLELAYFRGLSQREIARELAEPLGTVKTRMRAGIRKLRRALHAHPTPLSGTRG